MRYIVIGAVKFLPRNSLAHKVGNIDSAVNS